MTYQVVMVPSKGNGLIKHHEIPNRGKSQFYQRKTKGSVGAMGSIGSIRVYGIHKKFMGVFRVHYKFMGVYRGLQCPLKIYGRLKVINRCLLINKY